MKLIFTFLMFFLSTSAIAQTKDLATLPAYDCSLKKIMTIVSKPTIIVSPGTSAGLETILNDYCAAIGANCIRKNEVELTNADLSKNLFLIGILKNFKKWKAYKTPVTPIDKGFSVNSNAFRDKNDGFVFVDTNKIIISGNSLKAIKDAQLAFTGGHDILITQNGKITFFGNAGKKGFDWFNLQNVKSLNYTEKVSGVFSSIYVSKNFKDTINYIQLNTELQLYAQKFLSAYDLKMPTKKGSWFIHSNMKEYGTMSGMFGLTCPGNSSAGFSIRGEIHTNGFNIGLVKHEYSHFLFDNNIPQENNTAFFVEGSVEYITNRNDTVLYTQRINIAKKYKDTLNYADLIVNNKDFYSRYSEANYSICGVFVKYLIDNFGVVAFKKYCLAVDKYKASPHIFNKDFEALVNGYKYWLNEQ